MWSINLVRYSIHEWKKSFIDGIGYLNIINYNNINLPTHYKINGFRQMLVLVLIKQFEVCIKRINS